MKNSSGATWDAATAGNTIGTWVASFGDEIDVIVSNNDGMAMAIFNAWSQEEGVPTFGYDANNDAVAAIEQGYGGTISQHAFIQEQSLGIHYNQGSDLMDYLTDRSVFEYEDGYVNLLKKPGLGIDVNEEKIREKAESWENWRNPVWHTEDGAVAEW